MWRCECGFPRTHLTTDGAVGLQQHRSLWMKFPAPGGRSKCEAVQVALPSRSSSHVGRLAEPVEDVALHVDLDLRLAGQLGLDLLADPVLFGVADLPVAGD